MDATIYDQALQERALRNAYRTRDGSIPWGLTPIEQVGLRVQQYRDGVHARIERASLAIRQSRMIRSNASQEDPA